MDEYAQIYWLDERNAARDHRPHGGNVPAGWRPSAPPPSVTPPAVVRPLPPMVAQPVMAQPMVAHPVMAHPLTAWQPQSPTYLGGLTLGQILELAAQALAAFQSLPSAPIATSDVEKDVGNLVLYQTALAEHAKRDERLRTLGSLISKFVK